MSGQTRSVNTMRTRQILYDTNITYQLDNIHVCMYAGPILFLRLEYFAREKSGERVGYFYNRVCPLHN